MSELDPVTLKKIARELESMPSEDRALVYRVIPELAEANTSDGVQEPNTPSRGDGSAFLKSAVGMEERVRAATSGFDFTTLTSQQVVGCAVIDSEQRDDAPPADRRAEANSTINTSAKTKVSPLLIEGPASMRPSETAPTLSSHPSAPPSEAARRLSSYYPAPRSGAKGHLLMIAVCGVGLVLLSYATKSRQREVERIDPSPAIRFPAVTPAPAMPNVVVESSLPAAIPPAALPAIPEQATRLKAPPERKRARITANSGEGRAPRRTSKFHNSARYRGVGPDPGFDRDVNELLNRL